MSNIRVRFAPSPTGPLHLGGLRTALFNYLFAKKNNGTFILRIEDTDRTRFVPWAEDYIKKSLDWVGITPDESPWNPNPKYGSYRQTERLDVYKPLVDELIANGKAYIAFDSKDEIDALAERFAAVVIKDGKENRFPASYGFKTRMYGKNSLTLSKDEVDALIASGATYVVRFKVDANIDVTFNDEIRGDITISTNEVDDKVLIKSDGIPTYHFANVVDDHTMEITHVIRGEEWLPSTPIHVLLYDAFGWTPPKFAHLSLLLNPDGKGKLSKRMADKYGFSVFPLTCDVSDDKGDVTTVTGWKEKGYDPHAFINFLALLGWNPGDDVEFMDMNTLIDKFSLSGCVHHGAKFDHKKADSFNSHYLRLLPDDVLIKYIKDNIDGSDKFEYGSVETSMIATICKERATFMIDLLPTARLFFSNDAIDLADKKSISDDFKTVFSKIDFGTIDWDIDSIKNAIYNSCESSGIKMGKVMPSLRIAVTGGIPGPDLISTMFIIGSNQTSDRIKNCL
jgi:glutamyl-tRNA synthetase